MRKTNKLTAIYMTIIIGFISFTTSINPIITNTNSNEVFKAELTTENVDIKKESLKESIIPIKRDIVKASSIEYEETVNEIEEESIDIPVEIETNIEEVSFGISNEEIELIALVTMAEAEGECEEGKRLVIDTILNRVDSEHFPNTISEVIYQPHQFSSMWNGRVDRCYVNEDICQLVKEELQSRYNSEVVFFCAYGYSAYGVPMFQVENHYFSSYTR